jgi:hypothetical protein
VVESFYQRKSWLQSSQLGQWNQAKVAKIWNHRKEANQRLGNLDKCPMVDYYARWKDKVILEQYNDYITSIYSHIYALQDLFH